MIYAGFALREMRLYSRVMGIFPFELLLRSMERSFWSKLGSVIGYTSTSQQHLLAPLRSPLCANLLDIAVTSGELTISPGFMDVLLAPFVTDPPVIVRIVLRIIGRSSGVRRSFISVILTTL